MNLDLAPPDEALRDTPIYRSVPADVAGKALVTPSGERVPVRIPLEVDNIWEWLRPARYPSRRCCAFGSPTPVLASGSGPPDGVVCKVLIRPPARIAQLRSVHDARHHPDVKSLPALLARYECSGAPHITALHSGLLDRQQMDELLSQDQGLRVSIQRICRYWQDTDLWDDVSPAAIDPTGEIIFSAPGGYFLEPLGGSFGAESSVSAESQVHSRTRATGRTS
jgi:hypothetical protein